MSMTSKRSEQCESILRRMESDPGDTVRSCDAAKFDNFAAPFSETLVLFGGGPLGKGTPPGLRRARVQLLAFVKNNPRLRGREVGGLKVCRRLKSAEARPTPSLQNF